tara:strand:+ start:52175 stop:52810 length:636 start_codon:yes stop_codon:yes gene_type:complete
MHTLEPTSDCNYCPRLADFRNINRERQPGWFNGPVDSFGPLKSQLLIIGLAPGLRGANRTGRPFTGDFAGDLLYPTLIKFGFAFGSFGASKDDGLELNNCRITNAVRCVPPKNKPTSDEVSSCRAFLSAEIDSMVDLRVLLCLGSISHNATLKVFGLKQSSNRFGHNRIHQLTSEKILVDSYHCSRLNTNTGRLTKDMFENVFRKIITLLN